VNNDYSYKLLDKKEYRQNLQNMHYSEKLQAILEAEQNVLKSWIENKEGPFTGGVVEQLYERYHILKPKTP
jgi:protein associated with RNAse G/E